MNQEELVTSLFKDPKVKVAWLCVNNIGRPVDGDMKWTSSKKNKFPFFDGYQGTRIVKNGQGLIYKVLCSINKSSLGIPIFNCSAYLYDTANKKFLDECFKSLSLTKITTVSNSMLSFLNVDTNKSWYGLQFFGLERKEVRAMQVAYIENIQPSSSQSSSSFTGPSSALPSLPPTCATLETDLQFSNTYNFLGIVSFGKTHCYNDSKFQTQVHAILGKTVHIPEGYESLMVMVHISIVF